MLRNRKVERGLRSLLEVARRGEDTHRDGNQERVVDDVTYSSQGALERTVVSAFVFTNADAEDEIDEDCFSDDQFVEMVLPYVQEYAEYQDPDKHKSNKSRRQSQADYILRCREAGLSAERTVWLLKTVLSGVPNYIGTPDSKVGFISWCNSLGLSAFEIVEASWILHDHMSPRARLKEKSMRIGETAVAACGPFNPHATGAEGNFKPIFPHRKPDEEIAVEGGRGVAEQTVPAKIQPILPVVSVVGGRSKIAACNSGERKRKGTKRQSGEAGVEKRRNSSRCYPFKANVRKRIEEKQRERSKERLEVGDRVPANRYS